MCLHMKAIISHIEYLIYSQKIKIYAFTSIVKHVATYAKFRNQDVMHTKNLLKTNSFVLALIIELQIVRLGSEYIQNPDLFHFKLLW